MTDEFWKKTILQGTPSKKKKKKKNQPGVPPPSHQAPIGTYNRPLPKRGFRSYPRKKTLSGTDLNLLFGA